MGGENLKNTTTNTTGHFLFKRSLQINNQQQQQSRSAVSILTYIKRAKDK